MSKQSHPPDRGGSKEDSIPLANPVEIFAQFVARLKGIFNVFGGTQVETGVFVKSFWNSMGRRKCWQQKQPETKGDGPQPPHPPPLLYNYAATVKKNPFPVIK